MKNTFLFFVLMILVFTSTNLSIAQWIQTPCPESGWITCFAVSGTNLFAGTTDGVFLSTDNGASWTAVNMGLTNLWILSFAVSGANLFAGTNGDGVFLSTDNGTSWTAVNTGLTEQYAMSLTVSGSNLFVGTDTHGVFLSTNNGTNWTAANTGLPPKSITALLVSGTNLFTGINGGGIFLSTNNGTSWAAINTGISTDASWYLATIGTNLFAGNYDYGMFLSTNNGTSWTEINNGLTETWVRALAVHDGNLFVGLLGGGVCVSTNNGTSWTAFNTGLTNTNVYSLAVGSTNIFAGTIGSGVWYRPLDDVLPVEIVSFNAASKDNVVSLAWTTAMEINNYGFEIQRRTSDKVISQWNTVGFIMALGTSSSPYEYSFIDQDLSPGRYVYRLKQIDRDGLFKYFGNVEVETVEPRKFALGQNYPNPFNPTTNIAFSLPSSSLVTLKIFDLVGREVLTLMNETKEAGTYTTIFNAANMPSGIYFYRLQAGSFTETKKLILLK